jgi:hypothetical protein
VAHHRYPCALLDLAHQRIAPARDDQIDVPVLGEQRGHFGARFDGLYERPREGGAREGGLDCACQFRGRARGLFSAFKDGSVAYALRRVSSLAKRVIIIIS